MRNFHVSAFLLAFSACPLFATVDQGLLGLVPADSKVVIGVDAGHAKGSNLGSFVFNRSDGPSADFQEFVQKTGFDPRRDLEYFLVAANGTSKNSPGLVLARGMFDLDRIKTAALAKGAHVVSISGMDVISMKDKDGVNAIAFPETGVAVAGSLALVKQVLVNRGTPTVLDPSLVNLITSADDNDLWFASTIPGTAFGAPAEGSADSGPMGNAQVFRSVREASGGVRLGEVLQLKLDATTRSPQDASALADVVRFVSNMIQTKAQNNPHAAALAPVFEQMQLQSDGSNVHIALSMPEKTFEEMQKQAPSLGLYMAH